MTKDPTIIADWIERVNDEGVNLSQWETDFMLSLTDQFVRRGTISDKQEEILEKIYTERVS